MENKIIAKREKIALILFIVGVIWWFAENAYFGWNRQPESALEGIADFMVWVFWGLGFFIKPTRIENTKIEHTTMINTPVVEIIKPEDVHLRPRTH